MSSSDSQSTPEHAESGSSNQIESSDFPLETSRGAHLGALCFAMVLPTLATLLYFVFLSGSESMKGVYFGSKVLQFSFPLLWVLVIQRHRICMVRPKWNGVIAGLLVGLGIVATGILAYQGFLKDSVYLQNAPALITAKVTEMGLTSPALYILFALFLAVPHAFLEEYYWRWFVFGSSGEKSIITSGFECLT